jgi:maleate isomerase
MKRRTDSEQASGEGIVNRTHIPFDTDEGVAGRAAIGLVILSSDHTIEHEFRQLMAAPGVAFYTARIRNNPQITPVTVVEMEARIAPTTELILPDARLDVVAYACTSATVVMGEKTVFDRIREVRPQAACTTPITAAFAAFDALRARSVAVLTPYRDDVNQQLRRYIEDAGYRVPVLGSFSEDNDNRVARISPDSVRTAVIEMAQHQDVDAVFVSCTAVRLAGIAREVEEAAGKPVTSSNHALAWHCRRLSGVNEAQPEFGQLFSLPLPGRD